MEKITHLQKSGKQYEIGGAGGGSKLVNHLNTDTNVTIKPNEMHVWGEMTSLTIQLGEIENPNIVNEYMFQFTSPKKENPTSLALPSTIKWYNDYTVPVVNGKIYQASIINNIIVMGSVTLP